MPSQAVYKRKYFACSLFLLQFQTASRSCSCLGVTFKDIRIIFENDIFIKRIVVTFQTTKGMKTHANLIRTIDKNRDNDNMCFINWFVLYIKNEFDIDVQGYNKLRLEDNWKDKRLWSISYQSHNRLVQSNIQRTGIENYNDYGTHSLRSGSVTTMLERCLTEDCETGANRFSHVFQEARTLGGWTNKSKEFQKYFKNSLKSTVVASRFVDPNS